MESADYRRRINTQLNKGHIPADLVVDRWTSDGERGLHRHFLFRQDVWTMFRG